MIRRLVTVLVAVVVLNTVAMLNITAHGLFMTLGVVWVLFAVVLAVVLHRRERHP